MRRKSKRSFLSLLLALVMILNVLIPSSLAVAQDDNTITEAPMQLPEDEPILGEDLPLVEDEPLLAGEEKLDEPEELVLESEPPLENEVLEENEEELEEAEELPEIDLLNEGSEVGHLLGEPLIQLRESPGGQEIQEITLGEPFWLEGKFTVPAEGDNLEEWVNNGDFVAEFLKIGAGVIFSQDDTIELMHEVGGVEELLGTLYFLTDKENIELKFNGTALGDSAKNVSGEFGAMFTLNADGDWGNDTQRAIFIIDRVMTVNNPENVIEKTLNKTGKESSEFPGEVEWTVQANVTKGGQNASLKDYVFEDDLTDVGEYVANSFAVKTEAKPDSIVYDSDNKTLSYTFGDVKGVQTVTFRTKIPEDMLIAGGTIYNTASFGIEEDKITKEGTATIKKKTLITKDGKADNTIVDGKYDPQNQTITWTIKVDPQGLSLTYVKVIDKLPTSWEWKSAKWEWVNGEQSNIALPPHIASEPTDGIYELNNGMVPLTEKVNLVIVSKVPAQLHPGYIDYYKNKAIITSDQVPNGQTSNEPSIGIGITSLEKKAGTIDYEKRQITWDVTVNLYKQNTFTKPENLKVYDLLIYDAEGFETNKSNLAELIGDTEIANKIEPKYSQKFVDGSFTGFAGLSPSVKKVMVNGKAVGDLLIVSGFDADQAYPFSFKTQVLDPRLFAVRTGKDVQNTAYLYYGDVKLTDSTATVRYYSKVLNKSIMKADGSGKGNAGNGFNYEDRTAVFRLDINEDGFDLTGADIFNNGEMKKLGKVTVVDTLPEGWSFVELAEGIKYELYKADGTLVNDVSGILATEPTFAGRDGTFVFSDLSASYYILVKAQLAEEQYLEYGQANNELITVTNRVVMSAEGDSKWKPSDNHNVTVNTKFLDKELISPGDNSNVLPKWTIYYNPYGLEALKNITITDTLPEGLSLKLTQEGTLAEDAVIITEYANPGDGTFPSSGGMQSNLSASYDTVTRKLTIKPEAGKLYKIEYETLVSGDITGNTILKNHVTVEGVEEFERESEKTWTVSSAWARGQVERIGMLQIKKVGTNGEVLSGAKFGLFNAPTDEEPMLVATSNDEGMAVIRGIPAPQKEGLSWNYSIKEIETPAGDYLRDPSIYYIEVSLEKNDAGLFRPVVKISERPEAVEENGKLTVANFKEDEVGELTVKKTVENGEEGKAFNFNVTIDHESVKGKTFAATGAVTTVRFDYYGKAKLTLKDGESVTIKDLPTDVIYQVEEEDYSDEYRTQVAINVQEAVEVNMAGGAIVAEDEQVISFLNSRRLGDLLLKKTVENSEETNREYEFTIALNNEKLLGKEHTFEIEGKEDSDEITFDTEGRAVVTLKDKEYIKILNLPYGTGYTITEADYSDNYNTQILVNGEIVAEATGGVTDEYLQEVEFINQRLLGNLKITKYVTASEEDGREFNFTITLTNDNLLGKENTFPCSGLEGINAITFDAEGKATVSLKDNEYLEIEGLPHGTGYTVTEEDYGESYSTQVKKDGEVLSQNTIAGTITVEEVQDIEFYNYRRFGHLALAKTVSNTTEEGMEFEFTITLDNEYLLGKEQSFFAQGIEGMDEITFDTEGKAVVKLKADDSLVIFGIPQGTGYTITEADYSESFRTFVRVDGPEEVEKNTTSGEIKTDFIENLFFNNVRRLGDLTLSKTVENSEETDREFEFTITLENEYLLGAEQSFDAEGVEGIDEITFDVEGKAVVHLKANERLTIHGLPQGTGYTITEADYSGSYDTKISANGEEALEDNEVSGEIMAEQTEEIEFINSRLLGNLTVIKFAENSEEINREFEFTIALENEYLLGAKHTYLAEGKQESITFDEEGKAVVKLKAGERITVLGLPDGTTYTVTEADYSEGYNTQVSINDEEALEDNEIAGEIIADETEEIKFMNNRRLGDLKISKSVKNSEEVNREFEFTIALDNENLLGAERAYAVEEREEPVVFDKEGKAVVTLKADESITILSLPQGTSYTVTEADYSENYYTQVAVNEGEIREGNSGKGKIVADKVQSIDFVNTRKVGDLTIGKVVKNGDEKEEFEFTIELSNKSLKDTLYLAAGKAEVVNFDHEAKATIKLAHNESITIHDLPKGTEYTVTEADYSESYQAQVSLNNGEAKDQITLTGKIKDHENQSVLFTNTGIDQNETTGGSSGTMNSTNTGAKGVSTGDNNLNRLLTTLFILLLSLLVIGSTVIRKRVK